jgi:hypothetical protein
MTMFKSEHITISLFFGRQGPQGQTKEQGQKEKAAAKQKAEGARSTETSMCSVEDGTFNVWKAKQ